MKNVRFYWARIIGEFTMLWYYKDKNEANESLQYTHIASTTQVNKFEPHGHQKITDLKLLKLFTALAYLVAKRLKCKKSVICNWNDKEMEFSVIEYVSEQTVENVDHQIFSILCQLYLTNKATNTDLVTAHLVKIKKD